MRAPTSFPHCAAALCGVLSMVPISGPSLSSRGVPVIDNVAKSGESLDVSILLAEWDQDDMVIDFEARNPWFQPSTLTEIRARDRNGNSVKLKPLLPGKGKKSAQNGLVTVGGRAHTVGSVLLPDAFSRDLESMELSFHGVKGGAAYATAVKVVRFRPVTPEDDARDARELRAQRVTFSARILGGAIWLGDGADLGMVRSTLTSGLGVRVSKGMHRNFAFDAEIVLGRAGEIVFDDVTWNAMQGDIHRAAQFGRLLVGGQLRFGDRIQPHAQFGLGFQGMRHDARFMMDSGGERQGPDAGLTLDLMWSIGVGMTVRINDRWTVAAIMSGVGVAQNTSSETLRAAFEGGLYVGYGWNP